MMEIIYLKTLAAFSGIGEQQREGLTLDEIDELEKQVSIAMPQTYREFLSLAGKDDGGLVTMPGTSGYSIFDEGVQDLLKGRIASGYVTIDKPFWAFEEMDGFEQFRFFLLDGNPNPNVYSVQYDIYDYSKSVIVDEKMTFSTYIEGTIQDSLKREKLRS